jgi:hypothetical protein
LAAATETNLINQLTQALPTTVNTSRPPFADSTASPRQALLLTLLFLNAVGLRRMWDLRGYTGDGLALLTGRKRAYSYRYTEAFLAQLAHAGGAEALTDALAGFTKQLWHPTDQAQPSSAFYVDGHRKPVYTEALIPRGLVGRLSTVLGCRALVLLHDAQGHPLLATTHRGDQHLTRGLPSIVARYEKTAGLVHLGRLIVDREGMAAAFLASLAAMGRTVVTVLRTDQYADLTSFTEVGDFVPLCVDQQGKVVREVAPACITLPLPDHPDASLCLQVALIRDLHRQVPVHSSQQDADGPHRWDADLNGSDGRWWENGWQATPTPAIATTAKLIPIVTTASTVDAVELVQTYTQRWTAQENVIKDFLLPLGLDTNHGFAKTPVENSEVAKRRAVLEKRLAKLQRWADAARTRSHQASQLYSKRCAATQERATELARRLNKHQLELERQGVDRRLLSTTLEEEQAMADAQLAQYQSRQWRAYETSKQELAKCERYCQQQRDVLRALEDLTTKERAMYELDTRKDQIMTVCKVALTNLVMWVRDHYFPATYAHATWHRLAPFFRLTGRLVGEAETLRVELRPFNDRQLNRDLALLCARVNEASPRLPDGRHLVFALSTLECRILAAHDQGVT